MTRRPRIRRWRVQERDRARGDRRRRRSSATEGVDGRGRPHSEAGRSIQERARRATSSPARRTPTTRPRMRARSTTPSGSSAASPRRTNRQPPRVGIGPSSRWVTSWSLRVAKEEDVARPQAGGGAHRDHEDSVAGREQRFHRGSAEPDLDRHLGSEGWRALSMASTASRAAGSVEVNERFMRFSRSGPGRGRKSRRPGGLRASVARGSWAAGADDENTPARFRFPSRSSAGGEGKG